MRKCHNGRIALVAGFAVAMLSFGCKEEGARPSSPVQKAPPAVTVSQPVQREITEWDEYSGRFDAAENVEVRARVSGHLTEVRFKDGQVVKRGDILFVLDERPFQRALEQARAELFAAATKVENANLDIVRGKPLVERKIISDKEFDDRMSIVRNAEAAVKVAEAKVKSAELDLSFTTIAAPIAGRIGRTLVTAGNWVSAGGMVEATLLTTIVSQDPIYVYFDISENNYIKYKRQSNRISGSPATDFGARVEVGLPDESRYPHEARLDFLDNHLGHDTGTLTARAVVANPSGLLSPGLFARVRVTGSAPYTALLVSDEAIGTDQTGKFVYVVGENGSVIRRDIVLGPVQDGVRAVREGLAADDWVIVRGMQRVAPGDRATPRREQEAVPQPANAGR
jgi:RND family efflux transporter MFP subunit